MLNWFRKKPDAKYADQLAQLHKKGYTDEKRNVEKLDLYGGDVNLVIIDYDMEKATNNPPAKQTKPSETNTKSATADSHAATAASHREEPKPMSSAANTTSEVTPTQHHKQEPEKTVKHQESTTATSTEATHVQVQAQAQAQAKEKTEPKVVKEEDEKTKEQEKAKSEPKHVPKPEVATTEQKVPEKVEPQPTKPPSTVTLLKNLNGLHAYDLRNVFYAMGDRVTCEILYSYSINGTDLYDYVKVNSLLANVNQNLAFENEAAYLHFVHEIEKTFAKHGVVQSKHRITCPTIAASKAVGGEQVRREETKSDEKINDKMISSQVCAVLQKHNSKFAQRLYSFSVDGAALFTLSYGAIVRLTGVTPQELSEDAWHKLAHSLGLPKIVERVEEHPPRASKKNLEALEQQQKDIIRRLESLSKQVKEFSPSEVAVAQEATTEKAVAKEKKQTTIDAAALAKTQQDQLKEILSMQDAIDRKTMSPELFQLKQHQVHSIQQLEQLFFDKRLFPDQKQAIRLLIDIADQSEKNSWEALKSGGKIEFSNKRPQKPQSGEGKESKEKEKGKKEKQQKANNNEKENAKKGAEKGQQQKHKGGDDKSIEDLNRRYDSLFCRLKEISMEMQTYASANNINLNKVAAIPAKAYNLQLTPENVHSLETKMEESTQRLLHLAILVKQRAEEQGVILPQRELVNELCFEIAKELEQKQVGLIEKLETLLRQASVLTQEEEEKKESVESSTVTKDQPHEHASEKKTETEEKKTETKTEKKAKDKKSRGDHKHQAQDFKSRKHSLQVGANQLETVLKELSGDDIGDTALLAVALRQLHIYNETNDKSTLPAYIESIIPNISDDKGQINYKLMCTYLSDPTSTQSLPNSDQWNAFRESMIGQARKSDHLRIYYCLDGWPESKILELDAYKKLAEAVKHNNQIELSPLVPLILHSLGKNIEFAEFRVRTSPEASWQQPDKTNPMVPVSFAKDGWGQVFIWLRSTSFVNKTGGVPFE